MTPIRVVIADDHPLYRDGVSRTLTETGRFAVVAQAATAREALAQVQREAPDLVLLDISMPDGGLATLRQIMALSAPPRVAMLTVSEEDDDIMQALKAGALGYILKGVGARDLAQIVADLAEGRSYVALSLAIKVLAAMHALRPAARPAGQPDPAGSGHPAPGGTGPVEQGRGARTGPAGKDRQA